MKDKLGALAAVAYTLGLIALIAVGTVNATPTCNGKTPYLGHCGEVDTCEGRPTLDCTTSFADYPGERFGISCQTGDADDHCVAEHVNNTPVRKKCMCEYDCTLNEVTGACSQGAPNIVGGNHVCSRGPSHISVTCNTPGSP